MMHIDIHSNASADLHRLRKFAPEAVASVLMALQQLQADPLALDKLTTHGNNDLAGTKLNVKRWESARSRRGDLWRFRALETPATTYRVIYGYDWRARQMCVLAVVSKDEFDYDTQSDLGKRIFADWRNL